MTNHMKNIHDAQDPPAGFLDSTNYSELDREETFMRTTAQIMTTDAFLQDILEGVDAVIEDSINYGPSAPPHVLGHVETLSTEPTTTHRTPTIVPLCHNANNFIVQKGKTVPASFLETLLPPEGFLQDLDRSRQEQDNTDNLLKRFEQEIRCFKCQNCEFTCSGMNNLQSHMNAKHPKVSPAPDMQSLGDYLNNLERKMDQCYSHMIKQSSLIEKLSSRLDSRPISVMQDIIQYYKCDQCHFETEGVDILNNHKRDKHEGDTSKNRSLCCDQCDRRFNQLHEFNKHKSTTHNKKTFECPMCDFISSLETEITNHVDRSHPEKSVNPNKPSQCNECQYTTHNTNQLTNHMNAKHNKQPKLVECPMCNYKNSSESIVAKHVEETHPEKYECVICKENFENQDSLKSHTTNKHKQKASSKVDWGLIVGDSHMKSVQTRRLEKACRGKRLRNPASSSRKEGSAYTTTKYWPNARFPESNLEDRVPKLLKERKYDYLITLTPSNNIKNIENEDVNEQYKLAEHTAFETLAIVEQAIEKSETLKNAVIMELPPRADSARLQSLTEYCNFILRDIVSRSKYKQQITLGSFDRLYDFSENDIFGHRSSNSYDGIHLRGEWGSEAFTDCIRKAVKRSRFSSNLATTTPTSIPISTSNQFEVLSN